MKRAYIDILIDSTDIQPKKSFDLNAINMQIWDIVRRNNMKLGDSVNADIDIPLKNGKILESLSTVSLVEREKDNKMVQMIVVEAGYKAEKFDVLFDNYELDND